MLIKTAFGSEAELTPETYGKMALLGFGLFQSNIDGQWNFTNSRNDAIFLPRRSDSRGVLDYPTAEEAALAGIKYYTSGNKP